jgi:hypothetical protein
MAIYGNIILELLGFLTLPIVRYSKIKRIGPHGMFNQSDQRTLFGYYFSLNSPLLAMGLQIDTEDKYEAILHRYL